MVDRCNRLMEAVRVEGVDAVLITSRINRMYFSGFTGSDGILFISPGRRVLITAFRYTIQANIQCKGTFEVLEASRSAVMDIIKDELSRIGARHVGFEDAELTVRQYNQFKELGAEFVPCSNFMAKIRVRKDKDEIEHIIKAQNAADAAFAELVKRIKPGMSELEVANELEYLMKKHGAEDKSFDTIVGSGENGALCHAVPGNRKLRHGDMVVLDFGCKVNGYCSDMTRTIAVGTPCGELMKIYGIVREAQRLALEGLKPGAAGRDIDALARNYIASHGYGDNFGHSLGHGFGLEVHEAPGASTVSSDVFEPGMTITVEPGIYIEGLGGVRIEDCCIITDNGYINPVTTTKELIIIE